MIYIEFYKSYAFNKSFSDDFAGGGDILYIDIPRTITEEN